MSTERRPATKTEGIREFVGIALQDDITDLRDIPIRETTINLGLGLLMILVTILHFALNIWQFAVSLLLVGYDLIAKGLTKIMPTPKKSEVSSNERQQEETGQKKSQAQPHTRHHCRGLGYCGLDLRVEFGRVHIGAKMTVEMQTFIEQKETIKCRILELENDNRRLQREIDSKEAEMKANQDEIQRLYSILRQIGQPIEGKE